MGYVEEIRKKIGNYPLILCGAGVLVYRDNKILLQRRSDNKLYGIPGGCVELFEKIEDTAKRELFEETGLTANSLVFYKVTSDKDFTYPNGDRASIISIDFLCSDFSGEIIDCNEETIECTWFDADKLPDDISPPDKATIHSFADMLISIRDYKKMIYDYELILANRLIKDASQYITEDFTEYCSGGSIINYSEAIEHYKSCEPKDYTISDFEVNFLHDNIVQVKYISELEGKRVLRSSLWRLADGKWKMFFHQGTPVI